MAIELINKDILQSGCDIIAHGVNCVGGFGSGIAAQIAQQHPYVKKQYLAYHKNVGWELGDIQFVYTKSKLIANCATQKEYMPRDVIHANYHAIERICKKLRYRCKDEDMTLAMPKIGCGLAGGDWNVVEEIYNNVFHDMLVKVYWL